MKHSFSNGEINARFFVFFWALAILVDEARSPATFAQGDAESWLSFAVYALAALLLRIPGSSRLLLILAVVYVLQLAFDWPNTTNHSAIIGFVNLFIIFILLHSRIKNGALLQGALYSGFPLLRLGFLIMYGSAALSKLNSSFLFDLTKSCANVLATEELSWLPVKIDFQELWFLPWLVFGAEILVFLLPIFSKTRFLGIILAVIFHTTLSLTPDSKDPGFTLVLFALLGLFLDEQTRFQAVQVFRRLRAKVRKTFDGWITNFLFFSVISIQANISFFQGWFALDWWRWLGTLVINIIWGVIWIFLAIQSRNRNLEQKTVILYGSTSAVLVVLVVVNSASPYLGGKTSAL